METTEKKESKGMKLKKIKTGYYVTTDGKIYIEKDRETGFWYACDTKTHDCVTECERTLWEIKFKLGIK